MPTKGKSDNGMTKSDKGDLQTEIHNKLEEMRKERVDFQEEMKKMTKYDKEDLQTEIYNKLEEMRKERVDFQEEIEKIMINVRTSVDEKIHKLADNVAEQTSEMADFKEEEDT